MVWPCGPNSVRVVCRVRDRDRGHDHGDDGRGHVSDRVHGRGHDRVNAHGHVNGVSCGRGGASCRLRGHAIRQDLICHGHEGLH